MINILKSHYKNFSKFAVVGASNTVIDLTVFYILYQHFEIYFVFAHISAFLVAVINSFVFNALWTFKSLKRGQILRQVISFILVAVVGLCVSSIAIYIASFYVHIYIAKIFAIMAAMSWNYMGSWLFVFKKRSVDQGES